MKYKTIKEVKAAMDSGEIQEGSKIVVDNDCAHLYVGDEDEQELVWESDGAHDLQEQLLDAIGIQWEPC